MSRWIGVVALVAMGCTACGGEAPQAPAGPSTSALGASSVTQGARILGNVSAGTPLAATAAQVVGTPISAPVNAAGGFSLEGVPEGQVQLRFVGSGVDASVALSPVRQGDVVSLLVGVAGATATIQSESRNAGGKVELEGRIESLPPTQDALTLVVGGRTVTTDAETLIRDSNDVTKAFADLAIGQRVHVKGTLGTESILADSILIQNTITTIPVNVNGIVELLNTPPPATAEFSFRFQIGSRVVQGDAETAFYGDNDVPLTDDDLENGQRVEVKGELRDGFVYAVRIHINGLTGTEPPQDDSASVEGVLDVLTGGGSAWTLTLLTKFGPVTVTTTADTIVQRRGDVQTLDDLAEGQTIHAVGTRMSDKTIVARMLQIKDDATDGAFTIEGSLGGLKGACPFTFAINGFSITTDAATVWDPVPTPPDNCLVLKSGMKVEVIGTRLADGTVLAGKVTKK